MAVVAAVAAAVAVIATRPPSLSARDRRWQRDIAYMAASLPADRSSGGLGKASFASWYRAASMLEEQVPKLTDEQVVAGMARMTAMIGDDETGVQFPPHKTYLMDAQWIGGGLYLVALPSADRDRLGARLLAVDGHPVAQVLRRLRSVIDYQDTGLLRLAETGDLDNASLLNALGLARSPDSVVLTVQTVDGGRAALRLTASVTTGLADGTELLTSSAGGLARVPLPFYLRGFSRPYWLTVLPAQHAVYLKYNQCLDGDGFQALAAQALDILSAHPDYRLIIDLRDNEGGSTEPFSSVIADIRAA